jgi:hypothetical protein
VKYFHCPHCQTAYALGPKNPGYDTIKVNHSVSDNRLPIDQEIPNDPNDKHMNVRHLPLWKKMRLHLRKCVYARKIELNQFEKERYDKLSAQQQLTYMENKWYPPMFRQVKLKNDPAQIKTKDGKRDQGYARRMREQRKIDAAVAAAVENALKAKRR